MLNKIETPALTIKEPAMEVQFAVANGGSIQFQAGFKINANLTKEQLDKRLEERQQYVE